MKEKAVYVYNEDFELVQFFERTFDAARFYKEDYDRFRNYVSAKPQIIYRKYGVIPSREGDPDMAKEKYADALLAEEERSKDRKQLISKIGEKLCRTREELQLLADYEHITINWDKWNKLVEQAKQDIAYELEDYHFKGKYRVVPVYVYNRNFQLIMSFNTNKEAARYFNISPPYMKNIITNKEIWDKHQVIVSNLKPTEIQSLKDEIEKKQEYTNNIQHIRDTLKEIEEKYKHTKNNQPVYVYNLDGQFINKFNTIKDTARYYNISEQTVSVYLRAGKPYKKGKIFFSRKMIK